MEPASEQRNLVQTNVRQGALIGGFASLGLALLLMYFTLWSFLLYGPLLLASFILSIVAMSQRRVGGGIALLLLTILLPPVFGMAVAQIREEDRTAASSSSERSSEQRATFAVSIEELSNAYMENEVAADARFRDRRFIVEGVVDEISKDFRDHPKLNFRVAGRLLGVRAEVQESQIGFLVAIRPGSMVRLDCRGGVMILRTPQLADCIAAPPDPSQQDTMSSVSPSAHFEDDDLTVLKTVPATSGSFHLGDSESSSANFEITVLEDTIIFDFTAVGSNAHTGQLSGVAHRVENRFTYGSPGEGACRMDFYFVADGLEVRHPGSASNCGFGSRISAVGTYKRLSPTVSQEYPRTAVSAFDSLGSVLSTTDSTLARAYRQLLGDLSVSGRASAKDSVRDEQRRWIVDRDRGCSYNSAKLGFSSIRDVSTLDCFIRWTKDRAIELSRRRSSP